MLDTLIQDVKYAARSLRHTPGFTAAAIVTLALGMGANATIFTLLDAVLFKPLPVSRPDELLTVHENSPDAAPNALPDTAGGTGRYLRFSYPRFQLLQRALGNKGTLAASTLSARFVGRHARLEHHIADQYATGLRRVLLDARRRHATRPRAIHR